MKEQVYQIYGTLKEFLSKKKYYAIRLEQFRRYNFWMEILIAVGATGSGIAGFAVWQSGLGKVAWALLAGASAILATVKPFLKLTDRIEVYGKLYGSYTEIHTKLKIMVDDLQVARLVSDEILKRFNELRNRATELTILEDPSPNEILVSRLQEKVNKELSIDSLWIPS